MGRNAGWTDENMVNRLRELHLFCDVEPQLLKTLIQARQIRCLSFLKGETVHSQHARCEGMDVIWEGQLMSYALSENGSEIMLFEFNKNHMIGANLLFGDEDRYPLHVYCTANSIVFHVSRHAVSELLRQHAFVMPFVKALSRKTQGLNRKIIMVTQKTLRENLMDYFSVLASEQGSKNIILPMSKKQLADRLGVQRPSLFRELKRMKDEGILQVNNRSITLC